MDFVRVDISEWPTPGEGRPDDRDGLWLVDPDSGEWVYLSPQAGVEEV